MPISKGLKNSLNKIRQISSDIYHQYVPVLNDDTDISSFAQPILNVPEVYNEFISSLVNRIVYTQIERKTFNNPLRGLEGNVMPLGYAGQEIFINPAKGRRYNPDDFAGILQKYEADVKVQYLIKNMDLQYPLTVIRTKLKEAFVSWDALDVFITGLTNSLYNGMYIDEFRYTKALVSSAYAQNNVQVKVIENPSSSEVLAKAFISLARTYYLNFQMPSTEFNAWNKIGGAGRPITTWSDPEDIVVLIRNDIRGYLDVEVLANAFQIDKTTLLGNIYPIDNFDVYSDEGVKIFDGSNIYAMIADRNWFKIKPIDQFMETGYNSNNRAMQYFLNNIKMYEYSLFANAVVFATSEPEITITGLDYNTPSVTLVNTGDVEGLEVRTTPGSANTPTITYETSNESVFTVQPSENNPKVAMITATGVGTATLTAKAGNVETTIEIKVEN